MARNKHYDKRMYKLHGETLHRFHSAVEQMRTKATLHLVWESAIVWIQAKMKVTAESAFH